MADFGIYYGNAGEIVAVEFVDDVRIIYWDACGQPVTGFGAFTGARAVRVKERTNTHGDIIRLRVDYEDGTTHVFNCGGYGFIRRDRNR